MQDLRRIARVQVGTDLSTLSAHRLRTVIPTEAFCRKGINLHRARPNVLLSKGKRAARSWRENNNLRLTLRSNHTISCLIYTFYFKYSLLHNQL